MGGIPKTQKGWGLTSMLGRFHYKKVIEKNSKTII
jgi:hypothetical protein